MINKGATHKNFDFALQDSKGASWKIPSVAVQKPLVGSIYKVTVIFHVCKFAFCIAVVVEDHEELSVY